MFSEHSATAETTTATDTFDGGSETWVDEEQEQEFVFKVVVVGEYSVGKTSLVRRLLKASFERQDPATTTTTTTAAAAAGADDDCDDDCLSVVPTIGTDFFSRVVPNVRRGKHVRLQFWDTAGLERYAAVHASTYRAASAAVVVFDVGDKRSFESLVSKHLEMAARHNPELDQRSVVVVANKVDLLSANAESSGCRFVTQTEVQSGLLSLLPDVQYHEVSARTNAGVGELLRSLCESLLAMHCEKNALEADAADADAMATGRLHHSILPVTAAGGPAIEATVPSSSTQAASMKAFSHADEFSPREGNDNENKSNESDTDRTFTPRDAPAPELHVDPLAHRDEGRRPQPSGATQVCSVAAGVNKDSVFWQHLEEQPSLNVREHNFRDSINSGQSRPPPSLTHTTREQSYLHRQASWEGASGRELPPPNSTERQRCASSVASSDTVCYQRHVESLFDRAEQDARRNFVPTMTPPNRNNNNNKKKKSWIVKLSCCTSGSSDDKKSKACGC